MATKIRLPFSIRPMIPLGLKIICDRSPISRQPIILSKLKLFGQVQHKYITHQSSPNVPSNDVKNSADHDWSDRRTLIIEQLQGNLSWLNLHYERLFGIKEIREVQNKVLEAESQFVETTARRKIFQERIDQLKNSIKDLWDKIESTPRSSESYITLRTKEHDMVRQQLNLELELAQLKDKEQYSFDTLSRLLRRSHELERLRQERSKYWQIISLAIGLVASILNITPKLRSHDKKLSLVNDDLKELKLSSDKGFETLNARGDSLLNHICRIQSLIEADRVKSRVTDQESSEICSKNDSWSYYFTYIPGYSTIRSALRYLSHY